MLTEGGPQVLPKNVGAALDARGVHTKLITQLSGPVAVCLAGYKFDNDLDHHDGDAEHVFVCATMLARLGAGLPM